MQSTNRKSCFPDVLLDTHFSTQFLSFFKNKFLFFLFFFKLFIFVRDGSSLLCLGFP